jgi:hypothetical protein
MRELLIKLLLEYFLINFSFLRRDELGSRTIKVLQAEGF